MLKLTLQEFLGVSAVVEGCIPKYGFTEDHYDDILLFIGDPAPNGDIAIDINCPKCFQPQSTS